MVDLPDPESPVNQRTQLPCPFFSRRFSFEIEVSCHVIFVGLVMIYFPPYTVAVSFIPSISTSTTSLRLKVDGGSTPARSISLTFVPESITLSSLPCGQVLSEAIPSHLVQ